MDYLGKYQEYLKTVRSKLNPNKYIKESSQRSYYSQLQYLSKYFINRRFIDVPVYEIDDLSILKRLDLLFYTDLELKEKNDKGQNQYSVAFHHYIRMITQIKIIEVDFEESILQNNNHLVSEKIKNKKINKKNIYNSEVNESCYVNIIRRKRSHDVAAYTRNRAKGICDLCGVNAPFLDKEGVPYLETHHVITLASGGPDVIYNTVALCPNCHRKIHMIDSVDDKVFLQNVIYKYLLDEEEVEIINKFNELFDK